MHLTHRDTCRVCGHSSLKPVINLGLQHLQGSFIKPLSPEPPHRKIPCELVRCDPTQDEHACGLLQMKHSVPPSLLYSNYWYVSGTNQTMREHLCGIATEAESTISMARSDVPQVLDIGCNDLTLLNCFPAHWKRVGIDPSGIPARENTGEIRVIKGLFPHHELNNEEFDVITSIAMFYDLEDPVGFAMAIREMLAPDGTWIVEMSYMPQMLAMNSYDTICHEHLEYYSLSVLEFIMRRAGLRIYRVALNDINGGSIRCYVTHAKSTIPQDESVEQMRIKEFDLELDTDKPYASFQKRVEIHRDKLVGVLVAGKQRGLTTHIYGASTKGNTLLQWCGIDKRLIEFAADRNPMKHGAFTIGSDITIISEEESRRRKPDYYLVLPWHFKKEFVQREREFAKATGSHCPGFIFPLPEIEVIQPFAG